MLKLRYCFQPCNGLPFPLILCKTQNLCNSPFYKCHYSFASQTKHKLFNVCRQFDLCIWRKCRILVPYLLFLYVPSKKKNYFSGFYNAFTTCLWKWIKECLSCDWYLFLLAYFPKELHVGNTTFFLSFPCICICLLHSLDSLSEIW